MNDLKAQLKRWLLFPLIGFLLFFLVIVLNQSIELVRHAYDLHPTLAYVLAALLILLFFVLILLPVLSFFTLTTIPDLPKEKGTKAYDAYLTHMHGRLAKHRLLKEGGLVFSEDSREDDLQNAYAFLDKKGDLLIKAEASQVFLTTAVSQNGSLDSLFVLVCLVRLIYRLSRLYEGRPSLRRLMYLYSNVGATVLLARGLEDLDLIEDQIEPLIASLVGGSVVTLIPGAVPITTLVVSSISQGAVNALLTLRCGIICQRYLSSLTEPDKKKLRRSASLAATAKLAQILQTNTMVIIKAFAKAGKDVAARPFKNVSLENPFKGRPKARS